MRNINLKEIYMEIVQDPFRALRAKKAAYGFQARLAPSTLPRIGEAIKLVNDVDPNVEVVINNMSNTVTIYTDDVNVADVFKNGQFI